MDIIDLRFIVFILDSKREAHDGKVFPSLIKAREFVRECIDEKWGNKMIIGSFVNDNSEEMNIEFIETFGLSTSKSKIDQLELFTNYNR